MKESIGGVTSIIKDGKPFDYKWTGKMIPCKDGGYRRNGVNIVVQGTTQKEIFGRVGRHIEGCCM